MCYFLASARPFVVRVVVVGEKDAAVSHRNMDRPAAGDGACRKPVAGERRVGSTGGASPPVCNAGELNVRREEVIRRVRRWRRVAKPGQACDASSSGVPLGGSEEEEELLLLLLRAHRKGKSDARGGLLLRANREEGADLRVLCLCSACRSWWSSRRRLFLLLLSLERL